MLLALAAQDAPNPYTLDINTPRLVEAREGYTDLSNGRAATAKEIARTAEGYRVILLGESHDNADHHAMQAEIISALVHEGRDVAVGLEMFTRDNQHNLNGWTLGWWDEEEFIQKSRWRSQWGFDYELYRPIFEEAKEHRLPLVALNLPRHWVRRVGRGGPNALWPIEREWAPDINIKNQDHRRLFMAMIGGHPMGSASRMDNMIAAQVAWDEGMATTAADWLATHPNTNGIMVILAGSGHVMHGQGINYRLAKKGIPSMSVVGISGPQTVSAGLADYAFSP